MSAKEGHQPLIAAAHHHVQHPVAIHVGGRQPPGRHTDRVVDPGAAGPVQPHGQEVVVRQDQIGA